MIHKEEPSIFIMGIGWLGLHIANNFKQQKISFSGSVTSKEKAKALQKIGIDAIPLSLPNNSFPETFAQSKMIIYTVPPKTSQSSAENMIRSVLENARRYSINKAIYISSTSVYPENNKIVREEDAEYISSKHTGVVMKRLEDLWIESNIDTTILRCGGLFGEDREPGRFLKNRSLSNADKPVNMTHIEDVVQTVNKVILNDHFGNIFNVVSISGMTRKDFYDQFINDLKIEEGKPKPFKIVSSEKVKKLLDVQYRDSGKQ